MGAFYRGWYVVVHLCSNFALRRQMAPVQSIKFQTANSPIFCTRIIAIFWTTCIARGVFSRVIMGNMTHILPVLHWLEVVIAFVSSFNLVFSSCLSCLLSVFLYIVYMDLRGPIQIKNENEWKLRQNCILMIISLLLTMDVGCGYHYRPTLNKAKTFLCCGRDEPNFADFCKWFYALKRLYNVCVHSMCLQ